MSRPLRWIWSTPRSVSTALERCLLNVEGLHAEHEPYTDAYHFGPQRRSDRYGESSDPAAARADADRVNAGLERRCRQTPLLVKELAFQGEPYVSDTVLLGTRAIILTRRPRRVHASLVRLKPDFNEDEFGFAALSRMTARLIALDVPHLFVDGDDLQRAPAQTVRGVCDFLALPYSERLLRWREGAVRRWESHERASQAVWHGTLEASRGLQRTATPAQPVAARHAGMLKRADRIYDRLLESCASLHDVADAV